MMCKKTKFKDVRSGAAFKVGIDAYRKFGEFATHIGTQNHEADWYTGTCKTTRPDPELEVEAGTLKLVWFPQEE